MSSSMETESSETEQDVILIEQDVLEMEKDALGMEDVIEEEQNAIDTEQKSSETEQKASEVGQTIDETKHKVEVNESFSNPALQRMNLAPKEKVFEVYGPVSWPLDSLTKVTLYVTKMNISPERLPIVRISGAEDNFDCYNPKSEYAVLYRGMQWEEFMRKVPFVNEQLKKCDEDKEMKPDEKMKDDSDSMEAETTAASVESTPAPVEPTPASVEPTSAPVEPATAPAETSPGTSAPVEPSSSESAPTTTSTVAHPLTGRHPVFLGRGKTASISIVDGNKFVILRYKNPDVPDAPKPSVTLSLEAWNTLTGLFEKIEAEMKELMYMASKDDLKDILASTEKSMKDHLELVPEEDNYGSPYWSLNEYLKIRVRINNSNAALVDLYSTQAGSEIGLELSGAEWEVFVTVMESVVEVITKYVAIPGRSSELREKEITEVCNCDKVMKLNQPVWYVSERRQVVLAWNNGFQAIHISNRSENDMDKDEVIWHSKDLLKFKILTPVVDKKLKQFAAGAHDGVSPNDWVDTKEEKAMDYITLDSRKSQGLGDGLKVYVPYLPSLEGPVIYFSSEKFKKRKTIRIDVNKEAIIVPLEWRFVLDNLAAIKSACAYARRKFTKGNKSKKNKAQEDSKSTEQEKTPATDNVTDAEMVDNEKSTDVEMSTETEKVSDVEMSEVNKPTDVEMTSVVEKSTDVEMVTETEKNNDADKSTDVESNTGEAKKASKASKIDMSRLKEVCKMLQAADEIEGTWALSAMKELTVRRSENVCFIDLNIFESNKKDGRALIKKISFTEKNWECLRNNIRYIDDRMRETLRQRDEEDDYYRMYRLPSLQQQLDEHGHKFWFIAPKQIMRVSIAKRGKKPVFVDALCYNGAKSNFLMSAQEFSKFLLLTHDINQLFLKLKDLKHPFERLELVAKSKCHLYDEQFRPYWNISETKQVFISRSSPMEVVLTYTCAKTNRVKLALRAWQNFMMLCPQVNNEFRRLNEISNAPDEPSTPEETEAYYKIDINGNFYISIDDTKRVLMSHHNKKLLISLVGINELTKELLPEEKLNLNCEEFDNMMVVVKHVALQCYPEQFSDVSDHWLQNANTSSSKKRSREPDDETEEPTGTTKIQKLSDDDEDAFLYEGQKSKNNDDEKKPDEDKEEKKEEKEQQQNVEDDKTTIEKNSQGEKEVEASQDDEEMVEEDDGVTTEVDDDGQRSWVYKSCTIKSKHSISNELESLTLQIQDNSDAPCRAIMMSVDEFSALVYKVPTLQRLRTNLYRAIKAAEDLRTKELVDIKSTCLLNLHGDASVLLTRPPRIRNNRSALAPQAPVTPEPPVPLPIPNKLSPKETSLMGKCPVLPEMPFLPPIKQSHGSVCQGTFSLLGDPPCPLPMNNYMIGQIVSQHLMNNSGSGNQRPKGNRSGNQRQKGNRSGGNQMMNRGGGNQMMNRSGGNQMFNQCPPPDRMMNYGPNQNMNNGPPNQMMNRGPYSNQMMNDGPNRMMNRGPHPNQMMNRGPNQNQMMNFGPNQNQMMNQGPNHQQYGGNDYRRRNRRGSGGGRRNWN